MHTMPIMQRRAHTVKEPPELLKPAEVARKLRIAPRTVYLMIKRGELPCTRIGLKSVRIPRTALDEYIRNATS